MNPMKTVSLQKFNEIGEFFKGRKVLVAFSGGVDSAVLATLANEHAEKVLLLNVTSPIVSDNELEKARKVAQELGIELQTIEFEWLQEERLAENPKDRCYQCKRKLAMLWMNVAMEKRLDLVVEGTSSSDLEGYRPGVQALKEIGIISPFLDNGITKDEIREYARENGLSVAEEPSMACLATRFPYGVKITREKLNMVEQVERHIIDEFQINCVRARFHGDLVRIEVGSEERAKLFDTKKLNQLHKFAREVGFTYVTLDARGYRSGSLDEE
jgi:uncharacterized protein